MTSLDKSGRLFIDGTLRGSPLESVKLPQQAVYVSIAESEVSTQPLHQCHQVGN